MLRQLLLKLSPWVRALQRERDDLAASVASSEHYLGSTAPVLQYRQAHFELTGRVAPGGALPDAKAWPQEAGGRSYAARLLDMLEGRGAEIGPLNVPITSKATHDVLYVDHLATAGLRAKYPTQEGIIDIDRPMVNDSLAETLAGDLPLDWIVASQVMEHVPDPIRWMRECADVLKPGGLLSISLPDRRLTFDLLREESRAADLLAAHLAGAKVPDARCVYDYISRASFINIPAPGDEPLAAGPIIDGRGAVTPKPFTTERMATVQRAIAGEYLDCHAWVFTPVSFLLMMAQLGADGFLPFRLGQFYPTDAASPDRASSSFIAVMQKADAAPAEIRASFLQPLG